MRECVRVCVIMITVEKTSRSERFIRNQMTPKTITGLSALSARFVGALGLLATDYTPRLFEHKKMLRFFDEQRRPGSSRAADSIHTFLNCARSEQNSNTIRLYVRPAEH